MSLEEIVKAARRIGLDMAQLAHTLAHTDLKVIENVSDRAALMRIQRAVHDGALAIQLALNPPKP